MPEALAGGNHVSNGLLQLLDLGKSLALVTRPHELSLGADLEDASRARDQRDLTDLGLERGQELLRHPGRAQEPPALRAVLDLDTRPTTHARAASLPRDPKEPLGVAVEDVLQDVLALGQERDPQRPDQGDVQREGTAPALEIVDDRDGARMGRSRGRAGVVNSRFRNVPTTLGNTPLRSPVNARPEQIFFAR
jgi:hypothetical protein